MGHTLLFEGDLAQARAHYDKGIALYDPAEHRPLATRFAQDTRVSILAFRSTALLLLGYPEAGLADIEQSLSDAREISQAADLMFALNSAAFFYLRCGSYTTANDVIDKLAALAKDKGAVGWQAAAMLHRGVFFALTGNASAAVQMITSGLTASR